MALTADRNTPTRSGDHISVGVAAATRIFAGSLVCANGDGLAVPGSTATTLRALGRADEQVDNRDGLAGALSVPVRRGIFRFANSGGGDAIDAGDLMGACFIVDDETVAKTDGTGTRSPAGLVVDVDASGVWVLVGYGPYGIGGALVAANNLSDVASKSSARGNLGVAEKFGTPTFVIGSEAGNAITVNIQLKDSDGDLGVRGSLFAYLSDDANGDSIAATAPDGGVAAGTDGVLIPVVAGKSFHLVSEADGDIDVAITHAAGAKTVYLILVLPDGRLVASDAITFA